jgi:hypothetical protein
VNLLPEPQSLRIDVGSLAKESVASLYTHLVTRPTGRAVRLAIESRLAEAGEPSVSVVDFASVTILDFSCADEVVARLLRRYMAEDRPREAFFVFRGVQEWHREPIEVVLERQSLAAVAEVDGEGLRLLGTADSREAAVWARMEELRTLEPGTAGELFQEEEASVLSQLVSRRLVFRHQDGRHHALTHLLETY